MGLLGSELPDKVTTCKQHNADILKHLMFILLNLQFQERRRQTNTIQEETFV